MTWKVLQNVSWVLTEPVSKAGTYDHEHDTRKRLSAEFLNEELPLKKGDVAVILWDGWKPVLTEPIRGRTVKSYLEAVARGLRRPILPGDRRRGTEFSYSFDPRKPRIDPSNDKNKYVYDRIAGFVDTPTRLCLIKKYEQGALCPLDLLGDHRYFEGAKRRGNTNKIFVMVGS